MAETNKRELLERFLRGSHVLNLATAVNNRPSNRDVFYLTPDVFEGVIYVTTTRDSRKISELEENPYVSFTTVPTDEDNGVVSSNSAVARLSDKSIDDVLPLITAQIPDWLNVVSDEARGEMVVIEITFPTAKIFGDFGQAAIICSQVA
jgi:general stress protein 26